MANLIKNHDFPVRLYKAIAVSLALAAVPARADLLSFAGSYASELEEFAAAANQGTFNSLTNNATSPCFNENNTDARVDPGAGSCTGAIFSIFKNVRELVHTANDLVGTGPSTFSLETDLQGLGFALRWTAGEEYAAQGSASSEFVNGQLSGLASRLGALRLGASGFSFAGNSQNGQVIAMGNNRRALGGGASADGYSRLGGFFNWSYGWGSKDPTPREDAFDFDGANYTFGLDYRIDDQWTAGAVLGYTDQVIDFDSSVSIVDGGLDAKGFSLMPFAMFQTAAFYVSGSIGYQNMEFDISRSIKYPSFSLDPDVTSTNTETRASTDANIWMVFIDAGYTFQRGAWTMEPYLNINTQDISIDGFTERDINNDGFDLNVRKQTIRSRELAAGFRSSYTLTPSWGVVTPNIDITLRNQLKDDSRTVTARYANLPDLTTFVVPVEFSLRTDEVDDSYLVINLGATSVLRGGRANAGGLVFGGIQAFLNYKFIKNLENYEQQVITTGVRYEF